ncbi:MAG: helix-turn-helix domain-containing protein [Lachnospiraceae bacterium]|nr:helix-turn-helix domain-containing protein [Lachnospiraceae bacterium]
MLSATEKINIIRKRKGMQVGDVANAAGMSRQNMSNKLSRNNLQEDDIQKFATALGCKAEVIFTDLETGEQV